MIILQYKYVKCISSLPQTLSIEKAGDLFRFPAFCAPIEQQVFHFEIEL